MVRPNMNMKKKILAAMTVISLAFGAILTYDLMRGHSVNAKGAHSQPNIPAAASSSTTLATQDTGIIPGPYGYTMPKTPIYALDSTNTIFVLTPGTSNFTRLFRVTQANGNLIGIDFRPGDGGYTSLY